MTEKHKLSDSTIMNYLNAYYGMQVTALTCLPLGADHNASLYQAQTSNQTSYFVKMKRSDSSDMSAEIVELLRNSGMPLLIPPIKTIHGKLTQQIDDVTLIVYPFIEGESGFARNLTEAQWIQLGKTLRQIHEFAVPPSMQSQIRKETFCSKWRDMVRSIYTHIEANPTGDEIAFKLHQFMRKHLPDIRRLVDRAEELGEKLQNSSLKFVLCHSDIHGGNVLIDNSSHIYIVDWEEPIMAPKERDLMFIGGGVGNVWNQPFEEALFYKGYGETEIDLNLLAYYRLERIVEDIAIYSREILLTTAKGKDRLEMYRHFIEMFEPQGVVDIAFKTSES